MSDYCQNYGCLETPIPAQTPDPDVLEELEPVFGSDGNVLCADRPVSVFERIFSIIGEHGGGGTEVPLVGSYDSENLFDVTLIVGHVYGWVPGANDQFIRRSGGGYSPYATAAGIFTATGTDAFLQGNCGFCPVTASLYDLGDGLSLNQGKVAEMVKAWFPEYITTNGDNWAGDSLQPFDLEFSGMAAYRDFIFPYVSQQTPPLTSTADRNNFYPSIGSYDQDPVGRQALEISLLNIPPVFREGVWENKPYYNVVRGLVEHFFYHSGYDKSNVLVEPDGNDTGSDQAAWLENALRKSTARWKIVHIAHPGYSSTPTILTDPTLVGDGYLNYSAIRNITDELLGWGADLLVHGTCANYERLNVDGLPIIINGAAGGFPLVAIGTPKASSLKQFDSQFGAQRMIVSRLKLRSEFWDIDGNLRDSFEISKS